MSLFIHPGAQLAHLQAQPDRVILIAGGTGDISTVEDIREEMKRSGLDCEIVRGDVSDRDQMRKLLQDLLDCHRRDNLPVSNAGSVRDRSLRKMTDEEWLAQ